MVRYAIYSTLMRRPPDKWLTAKHATLIHISDPVEFDEPLPFPKRDPRAWVVLDQPLISDLADKGGV